MIRRIEIFFGILDGAVGVVLLLAALFLPLGTESTCSANGPCVTHSPIVWEQHPLEAVGYIAVGLGLSVLLFGLIYLHARTRNGSLLTLMWILVLIFLASVYLLAFTIFGMAAFFLGVFTLLAAIMGSALQARGIPRANWGGRSVDPTGNTRLRVEEDRVKVIALAVALLPSTLGFDRDAGLHSRAAAQHHGWIVFSRVQDGYYGGGKRTYVAHLSQPAESHVLTLILVHTQARYNGGASGVLLHTVIRISNISVRTLRGHLNFSNVYLRPAPAGGPPFGTYTARIYRGDTDRGKLLAQGSFQVIED